MSDTAYANHAIHSTMQQVLDFMTDDELSSARVGLSDDQNWQIDRIFELTRIVSGYIENTPSTLTSMGSMNNINSYLQQAHAELSGFKSTKNPTHLANANAQMENIIPQLAGFAFIPIRLAESGLEKIIGDLRNRSNDAIKALYAQKDALTIQVQALKESLTASELKVEELSTAVAAQKKEAIAVTAEVRAEYSKTEIDLQKVFADTVDVMKRDFSDIESTTKKSSEEILADLTKKQEDAKRIVQVVGNVGVTGNYQKIAVNEAITANWMRGATLAFFVAGVGIALVVLFAHLFPARFGISTTSESPWDLALRLITALAIAAPALYTSKESARHRTNSDRARQRELELASLGPFIELLPKDKKEEIVSKMTDRYFGKEVEAHEVKPFFEPKDILDFTKHAMDKVAQVAK